MYKTKLNINQTQHAIKYLRDVFQTEFSKKLKLLRVSAPLFVDPLTGLNDGLNGEHPVDFLCNETNHRLEIVHSLAKWKRYALAKYGIKYNHGLYADMNAIRKEEILDKTHSYYVDQWDWEKHISDADRNEAYLHRMVNKIYAVLKEVEKKTNAAFPKLKQKLPSKITFVDSEQLLKLYPDLSPEEREKAFVKIHRAIFICKIGHKLSNGVVHGNRAPDYDDWNLNGDLIVYDAVNDNALELSSMGIRVDHKSLVKQLEINGIMKSELSPFCNSIIEKQLPLSIGGGIGQSRLSMFLLEKKHIGEVQVSFWPKEYKEKLKQENIFLL